MMMMIFCEISFFCLSPAFVAGCFVCEKKSKSVEVWRGRMEGSVVDIVGFYDLTLVLHLDDFKTRQKS